MKTAEHLNIEDAIKLSAELYECSFPRWYKKFEKISIRGTSIRIPKNIIKYLRDEIVILPKECYPNNIEDSKIIELNRNDYISDNDNDDDDNLIQPEFPEFSKTITKTIEDLQGAAFLKTNWHCPKDAYWITAGQTLKVTDITDAYQLLKASSLIKQDLCNHNLPELGNDEDEYYLILKEWHEIHPGTEFRCFVKKRNLIAISPRDWPEFHRHIVQQKHDIVNDIVTIFKENIKEKFPMENFVFDIVRDAKDQVRLIDFSPFNEKLTESLAFDWDQLNDDTRTNENDDDAEFRYLSKDCGIQPTKRNNYGIPQDIIDMFSSGRINSGNNSSNIGSDLTSLTDLLSDLTENETKIKDTDGN